MSNSGIVAYGGALLLALEEAQKYAKAVAALSRLEGKGYAEKAEGWEVALNSLVAMIQDTDLREEAEQPKMLTTKEGIQRAMRERWTILLSVERKDGSVEQVWFEPYSFKVSPKDGEVLFAWHCEHAHIERIPLRRIRYLVGYGEKFEPRYDVEVDD